MTKYEQQTFANRAKAKFALGEIFLLAQKAIESVDDVIQITDDANQADWVRGYTDRILDIYQDMLDLKNFGRKGSE